MPKCEVARGHSWGLRWDGGDVNLLLASECDCFIGCSTATEQPMRGISKSFWHSISDFGPADQNASLSSPFERLRLRFIRSYWNWMSSSSVLENPGPWFPESSSEHPRFDERPQLVRCLSSSVLSLGLSSWPMTCSSHASTHPQIASSGNLYPTLLFTSSTVCIRLYFKLLFTRNIFMRHRGWISAIFSSMQSLASALT